MLITSLDMHAELRNNNWRAIASMRSTHGICRGRDDVAATYLFENCTDEVEKRSGFFTKLAMTINAESGIIR